MSHLSLTDREVLRRHRAAQLEARVAAPTWEQPELVFTNSRGGPLYGPQVTRTMRTLMTDAGLAPKRFHDLRHTAATMMFAMGVRLEVIQEVLGHASYRTTRDVYAHLLPEIRRDASDRIGAFLRGEA